MISSLPPSEAALDINCQWTATFSYTSIKCCISQTTTYQIRYDSNSKLECKLNLHGHNHGQTHNPSRKPKPNMWNEHAIQSNKICNRSSVLYLDQHTYIMNQTDKLKQACKLKQKERERPNIRKIYWTGEDGKQTQSNSTTLTEIIFNRSKTINATSLLC